MYFKENDNSFLYKKDVNEFILLYALTLKKLDQGTLLTNSKETVSTLIEGIRTMIQDRNSGRDRERQIMVESRRNLYYKRKNNGKCVDCGKDIDYSVSSVRCLKHHNYQKKYHQRG